MWAELTKKQLDLRRSFLKFHSFVRENEDKRIRAAKKIIEEKEMQEKRTQMIKETEEMCACLAKTKGQFEAKIKDYRIYEDYLVGVSNIPGELFHGVNDIIKRYESLKEAKEVIRLKRLIEMDELDNAKSRLVKMIERKSQALIEMNSKVVDLICRHDSAKDCSLRWENIVAAIKERTQMKQAEIDGVKLCTWNIYTQMCARKTEAPSLKRSDFEGQLMHIKKTLQELRTVQKIVAKQCVNYTGVKREKKDRREQATNRKFAHKNSQYVTNVKMRSNFLSLFDPVKNPLNKI
ncbi:PREDICTED: coiled-coil domain-containing protein 42A-like [Nicrophorus vespilloides]|uniref:Coiled-coil domain-containing protein 42A-like n=1 Tax=Nicrophorus vespilloides TaxID=110193 RepID=A0ABM1MAH3_NICVS|nr:PREDICTED: coiled-coil domain-containing protein 42A-like [Nicrophorus vespilloides]